MSALEQSFRDICARHNLHSVSVGLLLPNDPSAGWSVGLQRWDGNAPIGCWSGSGNSIAIALEGAVNDMRRDVPPVGMLADEALPELAA